MVLIQYTILYTWSVANYILTYNMLKEERLKLVTTLVYRIDVQYEINVQVGKLLKKH